MTQSNLGREAPNLRLYSMTEGVRARTQGMNLEVETETEAMEEWRSTANSLSPLSSELVQPTFVNTPGPYS